MHRLPQGYILVKDKKVKMPGDEDSDVEMTLEEKIEEERHNLKSEGLIPVTLASFTKWKEERALRKQAELEARMEAEVAKGAKGGAKNFGFMSGKALFTYDPTLFQDDDGAVDNDKYEEREVSDNEQEETKEQTNGEEESKEPEVDEALFAQGGDAEEEDIDFD